MELSDIESDLTSVLYTEQQIQAAIAEVARAVEVDYAGREPLLVGVLKGAVMVMADFARELKLNAQMDWMAVSSYGSGTKSSGVVRILKDLDTDLHGRDVIICASPRPPRCTSTSSTSASRSPTSSSSATASTSPRSTATCAVSASSRRTSTAEVSLAGPGPAGPPGCRVVSSCSPDEL
jgi:hypothetical protein